MGAPRLPCFSAKILSSWLPDRSVAGWVVYLVAALNNNERCGRPKMLNFFVIATFWLGADFEGFVFWGETERLGKLLLRDITAGNMGVIIHATNSH